MWEWKDFCKETEATRAGVSQWAQWGACKTGYGGVQWTNGQPDPKVIDKISRAYPTAIAGTLVSLNVTAAPTYTLTLVYQVDPAIALPTEIFVQERLHYPRGVEVVLSPLGLALVQHTVGSNIVQLFTLAGVQPGAQLTVVISPM